MHRRGFTLLEVVVALALMGSILVTSLLAFSSHQKQLSMADKRLRATAICDALVTQLSSQPGGIRIPSQGVIPSEPNWFWRTRLVGSTNVATIPLDVIELEVLQVSPAPLRLVSVQWVQAKAAP